MHRFLRHGVDFSRLIKCS